MSKMDQKNNSTRKEKKGGIKAVIVAIVVIAFVGLVSTVAILANKLSQADGKPSGTSAQEEVKEQKSVITADNIEEVLDDFGELPDYIPKNYTVKQNSDWRFPDGKSESTNAYVENSTSNETPVYFDLMVDATGEVVYSSPVLELGAKIENFALDKPLEKGEYECTIIYHMVDENQNELTYVNVGVNVIVEN